MKHVINFILVVLWFCGLVLAKGFWSTAIGIVFPPWALYLVAERLLQVFGWVA